MLFECPGLHAVHELDPYPLLHEHAVFAVLLPAVATNKAGAGHTVQAQQVTMPFTEYVPALHGVQVTVPRTPLA
jgi:hypothetical protein